MKNIQIAIMGCILILIGGISASSQEADRPMNLNEAVQSALKRSPALKTAAARIQESQSGLKEVQSKNWPSLSVRSSVTRGDNPVFVFGSLLEQQKFGPQNFAIDSLNNPDNITNIKNALVVGVPVFTGLELQSYEKMGKIMLEQAHSEQDGASQNTRFQTIGAYLQVLFHRDLLKSINERIVSSQEEVESARRLNAKGLVLGSDFFAAQAILSGLETQKTQLEKGLQAALDHLSILTGHPMVGQEFSESLTDEVYSVETDQALVNQALSQRSDMKIAQQQVSLAGLAYRQSGRNFWPKIDAFASIETNTEDFSSNPSNRMIGLRSDFPLGDPSYFSRKNKARAKVDEAKNFQSSAEEQIRIDVMQSLRYYQGAAESLAKAKETVAKAQKSLELFRPLYREGRQSIIEVLRAEEGLMRAQSAYLETLLKIHAGYAQLQMATGSLNDQSVDAINQSLGGR